MTLLYAWFNSTKLPYFAYNIRILLFHESIYETEKYVCVRQMDENSIFSVLVNYFHPSNA